MTRPRPRDRGDVLLYRTEDGKTAWACGSPRPLYIIIEKKAVRPERRVRGFADGNKLTGGEE